MDKLSQRSTKMNEYTEITGCRFCASMQLRTCLDFGNTALANSYLKSEDLNKPELTVPLEVVICDNCKCVQLKHTVKPEILFSNYLYESSTSAGLRKHFVDYADYLVQRLKLAPRTKVLEIASNDGVLQAPLIERQMAVLGVEPAKNIAEKAQWNGLPTICDFFNYNSSVRILESHGEFDVIVANNCFAHIEDIDGVMSGINKLLDKDGVFCFENAYLYDTVRDGHFSQVYHEHLFYHSIYSLQKYLGYYGFEIFDVTRQSTQGGSFRALAKRISCNKYKIEKSVDEFIWLEKAMGLFEVNTYSELSQFIDMTKQRLVSLLRDIKNQGHKIAVYSVPAKFTTWSKAFGITKDFIDFAVEDAKAKQGLYTPGTHIPIYPTSELYSRNPEYCLIGSYNFQDEIMKNNPNYKGKWILTYPDIKVV